MTVRELRKRLESMPQDALVSALGRRIRTVAKLSPGEFGGEDQVILMLERKERQS